MGKGFQNYMTKKFFHPSSKENIKRKWMAEQKTEYETKKQEDLLAQYQKEQEIIQNRALLGDEKAKLGISFIYDAPPGMKKKEKEDNETEIKFEWQRKYNAPREAYAKNDEAIRDQPFGIEVRNVRCLKCRKWGHLNTDKLCPLFNKDLAAEPPQPSSSASSLLEEMRNDGFTLKQSILGRMANPEADNQKILESDHEDDPEVQFLKSLTAKQKKKLMKQLNKLGKSEKNGKISKDKKKKRKKHKIHEDNSSDSEEYRKKKNKHRKRKKESKSSESESTDDSEEDRKKRNKQRKQQKESESSESESTDDEHLKYTRQHQGSSLNPRKERHPEQFNHHRSKKETSVERFVKSVRSQDYSPKRDSQRDKYTHTQRDRYRSRSRSRERNPNRKRSRDRNNEKHDESSYRDRNKEKYNDKSRDRSRDRKHFKEKYKNHRRRSSSSD